MNTPETMNNIIVHLFTCRGDSDLVLENLLCTRQALPGARLVVIDDEHAPCPEEIRRQSEEIGAEWRMSSWPRGGGLRGNPCITGILSEMLASSQNDNDVLVKIDTDTCLLDAATLLRFSSSPKIMWGSGQPDTRIYGCAYALKSFAAKKTLEYVSTLDLERDALEDVIIGFSVMNLYPDPDGMDVEIPLGEQNPESKWAVYHWGRYPMVTRYRGFAVVTTGNRPKPPLTNKQRRPVMRALRLQAKNKNRTQTQPSIK